MLLAVSVPQLHSALFLSSLNWMLHQSPSVWVVFFMEPIPGQSQAPHWCSPCTVLSLSLGALVLLPLPGGSQVDFLRPVGHSNGTVCVFLQCFQTLQFHFRLLLLGPERLCSTLVWAVMSSRLFASTSPVLRLSMCAPSHRIQAFPVHFIPHQVALIGVSSGGGWWGWLLT